MKPEIKAMLPDWKFRKANEYHQEIYVISEREFNAWLEKLTEGADVISGKLGGAWGSAKSIEHSDTHTALLICPREIDQRVPLSDITNALRYGRAYVFSNELADRIEKFGVK